MSARVALVTGAADGLGREIARALVAAGWCVGLSDLNGAKAAAAAADVGPGTAACVGLGLDVRQRAHFERGLALLLERWGRVDALVNNAALTRATPLFDISEAEFDEVIAVGLRGCFFGCQVFGAYFRDRRSGRIVNIGSLAGQNGGTATGGHYAAAKGGVLSLTKLFARELAPSGVTVNAIAPGPLDLPSVRSIVPPERLPGLVASIPVGALGDPAFVARLVVLLLGEDAGFVTGATWDANGGLLMR